MQIIAHRGASGQAPENTLSAFRLAWQLGADGIELDVRLSRDGVVMVHHDADTWRCAGVRNIIAASDSATLRRLDVGRWRGEDYAGDTIPLLGEVLAEAPPGRRVLVEIKSGPQIAPALAAVLREQGEAARQLDINVISFRLDSLLAVRDTLPKIPCYPVFSTRDDGNCYRFAEWVALARRHGFAGLDPDYRDIDAAVAAAAGKAGLELLTWTVNDTAALAPLARLGVAAAASDWPQQMRAALENER